MGARVYLPQIGRFASVDLVEGGTANNYAYVGDPVNGSDYSGLLAVVSSSSNIILVVTYNYGMQSGWGGNSLQSRVVVKRVQGPGSMRSNTGRTSSPVQTPKAANPAATRTANVQGYDITKIKQAPRDAWKSGQSRGSGEKFSYMSATSSAYSWYFGGQLVGGFIGCTVGLLAVGMGCFPAGAAGASMGGSLGAGVGFFLGGYGSPRADDFDWGADQVINPWMAR